MSRSFKPLHTGSGQERKAAMGDIVYLVKRPGYEFVLTVPTARPHCLNGGQTCFQVRLRDQHSGPWGVLDVAGLQDFYESLNRLMEYIHVTREKSRGRC